MAPVLNSVQKEITIGWSAIQNYSSRTAIRQAQVYAAVRQVAFKLSTWILHPLPRLLLRAEDLDRRVLVLYQVIHSGHAINRRIGWDHDCLLGGFGKWIQ